MNPPKLIDLPTVGAHTIRQLAKHDIHAVADLAAATPEQIRVVPGFGATRAAVVHKAALQLLEEYEKGRAEEEADDMPDAASEEAENDEGASEKAETDEGASEKAETDEDKGPPIPDPVVVSSPNKASAKKASARKGKRTRKGKAKKMAKKKQKKADKKKKKKGKKK